MDEKTTTNETSENSQINENTQFPNFQYSDSFMFPHVLTDQELNTDGSQISRKALKK